MQCLDKIAARLIGFRPENWEKTTGAICSPSALSTEYLSSGQYYARNADLVEGKDVFGFQLHVSRAVSRSFAQTGHPDISNAPETGYIQTIYEN